MTHQLRVCAYSWDVGCDDEGKNGIGTIYLIHPSITSEKLGGVTGFFLEFSSVSSGIS